MNFDILLSYSLQLFRCRMRVSTTPEGTPSDDHDAYSAKALAGYRLRPTYIFGPRVIYNI